ncbi:MAG: alpha/beta hydrolase [Gammaproteobacteria bacterium]
MDTLPYVEIAPTIPATGTMICLHGLGADGYNLSDITGQLNLPAKLGIRYIFPHAPVRPITLNNGYPMRGWYDILGLDKHSIEDEQGIYASEQAIQKLIRQEENRGIPSHRIVLAGFSQGGALALYTALRYPKPLRGVVALSSYLPIAPTLATTIHPENKALPIFMAHGTEDLLVPYDFGQYAREHLEKLHYTVSWNAYPMEHSICNTEIQDLSLWLQNIYENDKREIFCGPAHSPQTI